MAVAYVQHVGGVITTQHLGLTLPSATSAGDTAVVVSYVVGQTISLVSGLGATWTRVTFDDTSIASGNPNRFEIWVGTGCTAGNTTITIDYASTIFAAAGYVDVSTYSGAGSYSSAESTHGSSATASTGSVTSTASGQAVVGGIATIPNTTGATFTDTAGAWTTIQTTFTPSVSCTLMTARRVTAEAAAQERQASISSTGWLGGAVLLLPPVPPVSESGSGARARGSSATIAIGTHLSGSGARARGSSATEHLADRDSSTAARARGATATMTVYVPLVVVSDAGWEANGRIRDASATIDIDAPVVVPPVITHHLIHTQWLDITAAPTLDGSGKVDAAAWRAVTTWHARTWGRYRIRVGGQDVTYFRGAQTIVLSESDTEPGGDDVATVVFPLISPFERLGVGDLTWLPGGDDSHHIPVVFEKVDGSGTRTVRWEGDVDVITDTYSGPGGGNPGLQVSFLGVVKTLDERITKPRTTSDPVDICQFIRDSINYEIKYGWNGHGLPFIDTDMFTAERGGYGDALWSVTIQNLLAQMQTAAGSQYTITNRRPRGMEMIVKDRASVHFSLWCGQPGVTHSLVRDLKHGIRAVYGEGQDHGTQFWRNTQFPNAPLNPPAYPLPDGVFFHPGDSHTGFQEFADELRTRGYRMLSQDSYLAGDEDVVRDFQDDTGASVDGIVGGQTWSRAFALATNANLLYSYIRPLAVTPSAEPFLYNSRGGIIGANPAYAAGTRREKLEQFGTLSKAEGKQSAKLEILARRTADFVGTVTAENMDPPEMAALDTRAGMNLLFRNHRGVDRLLHVAKVDRDPGMHVGSPLRVTWTTSERGDDYVTLAARLQQKRDIVDQSGRTRAPRRGAKISPDFGIWDSESGAGFLAPRAQTAGLWNVYPVPAGERGTIVHVRLVANVATLIAAAVFNRAISPETLTNLPGLADPSSGSAGGLDPWQVNADYLTQFLTYADQRLMAWATGGPGAMQGYWPNQPAAGATVTGVLDDSASFPFHSAHGQWLWLAVWTSENCRISGDPAYGGRALFPGPNT